MMVSCCCSLRKTPWTTTRAAGGQVEPASPAPARVESALAMEVAMGAVEVTQDPKRTR